VQFPTTSVLVSEAAGEVVVTVQRTDDLDTVVTADYATSDDTAVAGEDYLATTGTLTFAAGQTSQTISVPILNDGLVQGRRNFLITLSDPGEGALLGLRSRTWIRISDNDTGPFFEFGTCQVVEGAGSVLIRVYRGNDGEEPTTVDYATADLTALAGTDYKAVSGTLIIAVGEEFQEIEVAIINDGEHELTKSFQVHLSNASVGELGSPATTTVTIPDSIPMLYTQPSPVIQSVSLGARVRIQVSAKGARMQWQHRVGEGEFTDIPGATGQVLELNNVTLEEAGEYRFVVSSTLGESVISQIAAVAVDPTFIKITEGPVVTDRAARIWESPSWWDYDNDGYLDLFVGQFDYRDSVSSAMYHNNGDGTFTKVANVITSHQQGAPIGAVGDYDNDGNDDLMVVNLFGAESLFRNNGQGNFTLQTSSQAGPPVGDIDGSASVGWADYDRDGFIDLFAANSFAGFGNPSRSDCLYRNEGDGSFTKMTTNQVGMVVGDEAPTGPFSWADYDNDGWPDLWVGSANATSTPTGRQYLWHNDGDGTFSLVSAGSLNSNLAKGNGLWADYDNDGDLDLFLTDYTGGANSLHRNEGGLTFTDVSGAAGVAKAMGAWVAAWGDFDNDGFLDLMVPSFTNPGGVLYRNNGDGTFTSADVGSPVRDSVNGVGVAWADYDNDGFLDLLITSESAGPNFLYRNSGNGNHWMKVKLVGTASNRSAIGAKVRVQATIREQTIWQMREITGNSGEDGGSGGLVAHFGLGDSATVDTLRIEWPSGIVQELQDVEVNQILEVVESQGVIPPEPLVIGTCNRDTDGAFHATVKCTVEGAVCVLESSSDLEQWRKVQVGTIAGGGVELTDAHANGMPARFYRIMVP
jgi:hypothetical protein